MLRFASVALLALFAFLVTGPAYAQQGSRRVGIGVAIGNPYDILPQLEAETLAAPTILIPIQVTDGFRLEPEIGIFRSRNEELGPSSRNDEAIVDTVNGVEVGVGLFPQKLQQNFRLYYGVRVGYMRIAEEGPFLEIRERSRLTGSLSRQLSEGNFCFRIDSVSGQRFSFDTPLSRVRPSPRGSFLPMGPQHPRKRSGLRRLHASFLFHVSTFDCEHDGVAA